MAAPLFADRGTPASPLGEPAPVAPSKALFADRGRPAAPIFAGRGEKAIEGTGLLGDTGMLDPLESLDEGRAELEAAEADLERYTPEEIEKIDLGRRMEYERRLEAGLTATPPRPAAEDHREAVIRAAKARHAVLTGEGLPGQSKVRNFVDTTIRSGAELFPDMMKAVGIGAGALPGAVENNVIVGAADEVSRVLQEAFPGDPARAEEFLTTLGAGTGSMAAFLAGGVVFGSLGKAAGLSARTARTGAVSGMGAAVQGTAGYEDAIRSNADAYGRYMGFLLNLPLGATEAIPIDRFFGRLFETNPGVMRGILSNTTAQSMEEFAQEVGQAVGQDMVAAAIYDTEREVGVGAIEQGAVGAILGAAMGAPADFMSRRRPSAREQRGPQPSTDPLGQPIPEVLPEGALPADTLYPTPPDEQEAPPAAEAPAPVLPTAEPEIAQPAPEAAAPGGFPAAVEEIMPQVEPEEPPAAEEVKATPASRLPEGAEPPDAPEGVAPATEAMKTRRAELDAAGVTGPALDKLAAIEPVVEVATPENEGGTRMGMIPIIEPEAPIETEEAAAGGNGHRTAPVDLSAGGTIEQATARPKPTPTEAQKLAGNYEKDHVRLAGFDITIETRKGEERTGESADGTPWSVKMPAAYGYIKRTTGADGEQVDVYVGEHPQVNRVFVIDQIDAESGKFDEIKLVMGVPSEQAAKSLYGRGFSDGRGKDRLGAISAISYDELRQWLAEGNPAQPYSPSLRQARDDGGAGVRGVAEPQGKVPQPEEHGLRPVRGAGDQAASNVDEIPGVSQGGRLEAKPAAQPGKGGQRRPLRAGQRPVGDEARAGGEHAAEPDADARSGDAKRGRLGTKDEPIASDDLLSTEQETADRASAPAGERGEQGPETSSEPRRGGSEADRVQQQEPVSAGVGKGSRDSADDDSGKISGGTADRGSAATEGQAKEGVARPADFGAKNKLVTNEEMAELRQKLREKMKNQLSAGVDPEFLTIGMRMTAYYIEGGIRKLADIIKLLAEDAGVEVDKLRPHVRAWYEAARAMMEDAGEDTAGMDTPEEARAAIKALAQGAGDVDQGRGREDQGGQRPAGGDVAAGEPGGPRVGGEVAPGPAKDGGEARGPGDTGGVRTPDDASLPRDDANVPPVGDGTDRLEGAGGGGVAVAGTGERGGGEPAATDPQPAAIRPNYWISDPESLIGGGPKARFARNKAAIEAFQSIKDEGREPTQADLDAMASYIGWGSFGQELFNGTWDRPKPKATWEKEDQWLREHLGQREWESAQTSIINAHYTDPPTVQAMWGMVEKMGFKGGRVLEPAMGVGNFFGLMPRDLMAKSELTGIEMDVLAGGMAKILYPQANIQIKPYQDSKTQDDFYDLVIGNWPFADVAPADRRYDALNASLHDYFFVKALDQVRPGGLVVGITSSFTMDKSGKSVRIALAKKAELVAAFRLPSGSFEKYAGTAVVTDIIILKKRETALTSIEGFGPKGTPYTYAGWVDTLDAPTPAGEKVKINSYYVGLPANIIGRLNYGRGTTVFREGMIVERLPDFGEQLANLPNRVPEGTYEPKKRAVKDVRYVVNNSADREGSVVSQDGKLYQVAGERMALLEDVVKYKVGSARETAAREAQVAELVEMRRAYGRLIDAERDGLLNTETIRRDLRILVDSFRSSYGPINQSEGLRIIVKARDPGAPVLQALETPEGNPSRILTEPSTRARRRLDNPTIRDAYVMARNETTALDIERIAAIAKTEPAAVERELVESGVIYRTPGGGIEAFDVYLSGNVRRKLREAFEAQSRGENMETSIAALRSVIPSDTPYFQIEAQLGATWVSAERYQDFIAHLLGQTSTDGMNVRFAAAAWRVRLSDALNHRAREQTQWGHSAMRFDRILRGAMNNAPLKVFTRDADGKTIVDEPNTIEVNDRARRIRDEFTAWAWADPERRIGLERAYNEVFRAIADPRFDGSFLDFSGMALRRGNDEFALRQHQVNAIWRGVANKRGVYAHEVGTGKTYTIGGVAVESRRYGVAKKPLIFAHNANSAQVAQGIREMYPGAAVLYVDNLSPDTIQATLRRIRNEDWDAIVVPHSLADRFALREETLMDLAREQIAQLEDEAIAAAADDNAGLTVEQMDDPEAMKKVRSPTAKQLVKSRERILEKIKKMAERSSREDAVAFEDLGVDMIIVDEAHEFKKPPIVTKMQMRGLNKQASARSITLQFLTGYVKKVNGGHGVHLFTGTPITNTLTEIFHVMRYVMDDVMALDGVADWDAWFNTFAAATSDVELGAAGEYEPVTRLAAFVNVAELRRMAGQFLDIVFADDMPEFQPRRTASGKTLAEVTTEAEKNELFAGRTQNPQGRPYKKIINDVAPLGPLQERILRNLQELAREFRNGSPKDRFDWLRAGDPRSPIIIEGNATKASLDVRLFDMEAEDHPQSKVNRMVRNALEIYRQSEDGTQMIFMENGYSDEAVSRRKIQGGGVNITRHERLNLAKDIVKKLVAGGVSEDQIKIVAGGIAPEKKKAIADAMNRGEVRFMIGLTGTMGTGVNAQQRLRAMHHLDAPWTPGELEQRNGRGFRQGNEWNTVLEIRYITEGLDGRRWQVLGIKDFFIKRFLHADDTMRVIEGDAVSEEEGMDAMGIAETLSEAAGDPRLLMVAKLKGDIEKLERRERLHSFGIADSVQKIKDRQSDIKRDREYLAQYETSAAAWEVVKNQPITASIGGKTFNDRAKIGEALDDYAQAFAKGDAQEVGRFRGFPLHADWSRPLQSEAEYSLTVGNQEYRVKASVASMEAVLRGLAGKAAETAERITQADEAITRLEAATRAPFGQAIVLDMKRDQLAATEADLSQNPSPPPMWLRVGSPVDTNVYVGGIPHVVTGHRWAPTDWQVITQDGTFSYTEVTDEHGMPLYEARAFAEPVQKTPAKPASGGAATALSALPRGEAPVFYSAVLRAVEASKTGRASPAQWMATIKAIPGVKEEELEWLGLADWLSAQGGPVTRDALAGFIRANQLQVSDVLLAENPNMPSGAEYDAIYLWARDQVSAERRAEIFDEAGYENPEEWDPMDPRFQDPDTGTYWQTQATLREIEQNKKVRRNVGALEDLGVPDDLLEPFRTYASGATGMKPRWIDTNRLPGGDNYRELLITLPARPAAEDAWRVEPDPRRSNRWRVVNGRGDILEDGVTQANAEARASEGNTHAAQFNSSHWPDTPNVVAHVRFDERTDADGKRTLFVGEVQSDWGQALRKSAALRAVAKPERVRKLGDDFFGAQLAASIPLKQVDGGVLALAHNNQIIEAVVAFLPIDVVNELGGGQRLAKKLAGNPSVVFDSLPSDRRAPIAKVILDSARQVFAETRTKLADGFQARRDVEILPALRASQLTAREIVSVLAPERLYHEGLPGESIRSDVAFRRAEKTGSRGAAQRDGEPLPATDAEFFNAPLTALSGAISRTRRAAQTNGEGLSATVAEALDWHNSLLREAGTSQPVTYRPSELPSMPFGTTWPELALKRMIRFAADHGYDQVAWTTGAQQVEINTHTLRTRVEAIEWIEGEDGQFREVAATVPNRSDPMIFEIDENGVVENSNMNDANGKTIEDLVGKEIARRIMEEPEGTIEGDNLVVGGRFHMELYDKRLVSAANKLGKKFGAQVGKARILTADQVALEEATRQGGSAAIGDAFMMATVHALPITDAMREAVQAGLPLFSATQRQPARPRLSPRELKDIETAIRAEVKRIAGGDVSVWTFGKIPLSDFQAQAARDYGDLASGETIGGVATVQSSGEALVRVALQDPVYANPWQTAWEEAYHIVEMRSMDDAAFAELNAPENMAIAVEMAARDTGLHPEQVRQLPAYEIRAKAFVQYVATREAGLDPQPASSALLQWFRKLLDMIEAIRGQLARRGIRTIDQIFEDVYQGRYAFAGERIRAPGQGLSALPRGGDPFSPGQNEGRQREVNRRLNLGQPIDRVMRIPFQIFGGTNQYGEWKPGLRLWQRGQSPMTGAALGLGIGMSAGGPAGAAVGAAIGGAAGFLVRARFTTGGRFSFLNPMIENVRRGLLDRYGLDPDYVERDRERNLEERRRLRQVPEMMALLQNHGVGAQEARALQSMLTGETITPAEWADIAEPIREAIDAQGQEMVDLGLISAESYERNRGVYLHRSYLKHEAEAGSLGAMMAKMRASYRKKMIGKEFKGRGLWMTVKLQGLFPDVEEPSRPANGTRFRVLDRVEEDDGTLGTAQAKVLERKYLPEDAPIPDDLADWQDRGVFEVRGWERGKVVLWRDWTKPERERMGEILDVRYNIAKTWMLASHDIATGRFYQDIAANESWATNDEPPPGTWKDGGEYGLFGGRYWSDPTIEWVKVPETIIAKSKTKRYGALAGMFVRAEIWRDINETELAQKETWFRSLMSWWKVSKTALSPVVHMNNVMSNMVFMDLADVTTTDLVRGIQSLINKDAAYQEAEANGAFGADVISQEIRQQTLRPILDELLRDNIPEEGQNLSRTHRTLALIGRGIFRGGKRLYRGMVDAYQLEDEIFRMALYHRRRKQGMDSVAAANEAREQFIDYDIKAPWVNAARRSVLPFIAYTYRAIPLVARAIATRPWKLAKYFALAQAFNALSYAIYPGDEDEERRAMPEELQGFTWIGAPRMLRLPWGDGHGNPMFLDIRRWIPAGDIYDLSQGHSAIPLLAWLQPGGPLAIGAELFLNRQAFTGDEIVNELTDDWWDRTQKLTDYAWTSFMPSAAFVPGSWYWQKIGRALTGARDFGGEPYDWADAALQSVGIKVRPLDIQEEFRIKALEFNKVERELRFQMGALARQRARKLITQVEYLKARHRILDKVRTLNDKRREVFTGRGR